MYDHISVAPDSLRSPLALVFSDSARGGMAAAAAVNAVGGRVAATLPINTAPSRLSDQVALDAILVDLTIDSGATLDSVLDRIDVVSSRERVPTIVSLAPELIDAVSARLLAESVTLLCQPDLAELTTALSCAMIERTAMVQDISPDLDGVRLRRLADEVTRIARALANLSGAPASGRGSDFSSLLQTEVSDQRSVFAVEPAMLTSADLPDPADIRAMLRLRRLRDNFFDPSLFADPAWDMLLDLMAARLEGDQVAVSSLCIAAAVPPTTALRWIKAMSDHGLFEREADPTDGRRIFIRLSDRAANGMARYFAATKRIGGVMV